MRLSTNENGATVRTKNILTGEWGSWTSGEPTNPVAPSDLVEPPLTPPPSQPEAPEEGLGTNPLAMQSLTEPLVTNPLIQPESLVTDPIVQPEPTPMESPITDEPLSTRLLIPQVQINYLQKVRLIIQKSLLKIQILFLRGVQRRQQTEVLQELMIAVTITLAAITLALMMGLAAITWQR